MSAIGLVICAFGLIRCRGGLGSAHHSRPTSSAMPQQTCGYVRLPGPPRLDVRELAELKARFQATVKRQPDNAAAKFYLDIISRPGPGWRALEAKLDTIKLEKVEFAAPGVPLGEALTWLTKQARARDPDHEGISFILAPSEMSSSSVSHQTRLEQTLVQCDPGMPDLTMESALKVIVACAKSPVQYAVADCGIVFSRARKARPDVQRLEVVTRPGTRLVLSWSAYTNGVLDAAASKTCTYAPKTIATTNMVSLGFAHGSVLGVPGGPMAVKVPVNEAPVNSVDYWIGDIAEHGWTLACGRSVTLIELTWDNGGGNSLPNGDFATRRGRVILDIVGDRCRWGRRRGAGLGCRLAGRPSRRCQGRHVARTGNGSWRCGLEGRGPGC